MLQQKSSSAHTAAWQLASSHVSPAHAFVAPPWNPSRHAHSNDPSVSVHSEFAEQSLPSPSPAHSSALTQLVPSPRYPALHAHAKLPSLSVQVALGSQSCSALPSAASSVHSSMFVQAVPSPS